MDDFCRRYSYAALTADRDFAHLFRSDSGLDTIATHAGHAALETPGIGYPVVAPIALSSTFQQFSPGVAKVTLFLIFFKYDYSRSNNYTRECLEKCIAALEGATSCSTFASGLAALGALMQLLNSGDRIVCSDDLYGGKDRYGYI
ncbi:unnamed protein product [Protopolystoma xenopodis]|uniref:cystathionine gamma-lyase n=1 Tax=Protopolystoma xenopodis TaxID=117903 RepID=A0A3S5AS80_9PLAT|nr:unnamed protein product [Protopolystoma xenopodis]